MTRRLVLGLAGLAVLAGLALWAAPTGAEPPEDAEWGSITVEGAPVDVGYLADGALVYATTGSDKVPTTEADCTLDTETPDLFLVSFPDGPGCLDAIDTSGQAEGVASLATSSEADVALVALPIDGSGTLSADNLFLYERDDENLTEAWRMRVGGEPVDVAVSPDGDRAAVTLQTGSGNHRLRVLSADGQTQLDTRLPGQPRSLTIADNARYVAIGGNQTEDGESLGWVNLYDMSQDEGDEAVVERTIPRPRAGIVTSIATTDGGQLYAGLFDGTVRWVRQQGNDREVSVPTGQADPAHVDVGADGEPLFASAGNETARIATAEGSLATDWRTRVNGTAEAAIVRAPHLFAVAETVNALDAEGDRAWEITAGPVVGVNATGLGAAVATETTSGAAAARTSMLEGRVLHRNLSLDQPEPITVTPGGVARGNVTLTNTGAAILNLTPTARDEGLRVHATPSPVQLTPGQTRTLAFTVEADHAASPGERSIPIDLQARPSVDHDPRLSVEVTSQPNVTVELSGGEVGDRDVTQGQTVNVRLDLRNRGNAEAEVGLSLLQTVDDPWPSRVAPQETITVPPSSLTTARVEIDVPAGVPNGTENRVIVRGDSEQGASAVQVNFTVNPFQVVRLRPNSISQEMAPGDTRPYDLSVENLGSVEADVRLRLQPLDRDGRPCLPTAWGLTLGASRVTVPAQGSQPVRVEVSAPPELPVPGVQNGTTGCTDDAQRPSLRVELQVRSDEGSGDESVLFANVDPALAQEPEEPSQNRESFPGLAVLALVLAGSATLTRGAKP